MQTAADLRQARQVVAGTGVDGTDVPLVAKLERPAALEHLDEILDACDAVMVARGDLGLEMPLERVPRAQKEITRAARRKGVPVIVATQVLESMTSEARPTRAEVSDAANAVDDGVDAIMLAGETAVGAFPARTVQTLDAIIRDAETSPSAEAVTPMREEAREGHVQALCEAAVTLANGGDAQAIIAVTRGGGTARRLSALRPRAPIIAATDRDQTARRLSLYWGVRPVRIDIGENVPVAGPLLGARLRDAGLVAPGSAVVFINISPDLTRQDANYLKIQRILMLQPPFPTIAVIVLVFVAAAGLVGVAHAVVHRVLDSLDVGDEERAAVQARASQLTRAMTFVAYGIAALASVSFALQRFGLAEPRWRPREVVAWLLTHGLNIVIIVAGAFVVVRAATLAIDHLQFRLRRHRAAGNREWRRRSATLSAVLSSLVTATVLFVAVLMVLRELSIDVVPVLTGAGIAGLAIGFGAQNLVRDVISGFFLIIEDQIRVGDAVRINAVGGIVEEMNLRTIVLRDAEGAVHVFPNGTVTSLANLSKTYGYAVVEVPLRIRFKTPPLSGYFSSSAFSDASACSQPAAITS